MEELVMDSDINVADLRHAIVAPGSSATYEQPRDFQAPVRYQPPVTSIAPYKSEPAPLAMYDPELARVGQKPRDYDIDGEFTVVDTGMSTATPISDYRVFAMGHNHALDPDFAEPVVPPIVPNIEAPRRELDNTIRRTEITDVEVLRECGVYDRIQELFAAQEVLGNLYRKGNLNFPFEKVYPDGTKKVFYYTLGRDLANPDAIWEIRIKGGYTPVKQWDKSLAGVHTDPNAPELVIRLSVDPTTHESSISGMQYLERKGGMKPIAITDRNAKDIVADFMPTNEDLIRTGAELGISQYQFEATKIERDAQKLAKKRAKEAERNRRAQQQLNQSTHRLTEFDAQGAELSARIAELRTLITEANTKYTERFTRDGFHTQAPEMPNSRGNRRNGRGPRPDVRPAPQARNVPPVQPPNPANPAPTVPPIVVPDSPVAEPVPETVPPIPTVAPIPPSEPVPESTPASGPVVEAAVPERHVPKTRNEIISEMDNLIVEWESSNADGFRALEFTYEFGKFRVLRQLLRAGVDVNSLPPEEWRDMLESFKNSRSSAIRGGCTDELYIRSKGAARTETPVSRTQPSLKEVDKIQGELSGLIQKWTTADSAAFRALQLTPEYQNVIGRIRKQTKMTPKELNRQYELLLQNAASRGLSIEIPESMPNQPTQHDRVESTTPNKHKKRSGSRKPTNKADSTTSATPSPTL